MKTHGYSGRLRFLSLGSMLCLIAGIAAYIAITKPEKPMLTVLPEETSAAAPPALAIVPISFPENGRNLTNGIELKGPMMKDVKVRKGDTLSGLLERENITSDDVKKAVTALSASYDPKDLRSGQEITLVFEDPDFMVFQGFRIRIDDETEALVDRAEDGTFNAHMSRKPLTQSRTRIDGRIASTLYASAVKAGLPISILYELIYAYSFDIDFQRDIRTDDSWSVVYEVFTDDNGKAIRSGEVRYAELTVAGVTRKIYRYEDVSGDSDFYDEKGKSIRKQLLRTPLDVPRITSGYGMRISPIYGYNKMHKGLDFGAPQGTPIRAAGDGTIASMTYNQTYGNNVIINHPNEYSTLYGHMVSFKRGLRKGDKVKQGDTIGYVGSTGLATGSHLHYEVRYHRTQVNPSSLKFPPGKKLGGLDLTRFTIRRNELDAEFAGLGPKQAQSEAVDANAD